MMEEKNHQTQLSFLGLFPVEGFSSTARMSPSKAIDQNISNNGSVEIMDEEKLTPGISKNNKPVQKPTRSENSRVPDKYKNIAVMQ